MKVHKEVKEVSGSKPFKVEFTTCICDDKEYWDEFVLEVLSMKPKDARIEAVKDGFLIIEIKENK